MKKFYLFSGQKLISCSEGAMWRSNISLWHYTQQWWDNKYFICITGYQHFILDWKELIDLLQKEYWYNDFYSLFTLCIWLKQIIYVVQGVSKKTTPVAHHSNMLLKHFYWNALCVLHIYKIYFEHLEVIVVWSIDN